MNDSPSPARTLGQILDETVARYPERDALVYFNQGVRRSWRDFARSVDELACGLMARRSPYGRPTCLTGWS